MNPIQQLGAALRDHALDMHALESDLFRGVAAVDLETAGAGLAERLQHLVMIRAQQNAELFMAIAHLADRLSETEDAGEEWKTK